MRYTVIILGLALFLTPIASGQILQHTVPAGYENTDGGYSSGFPFGVGGATNPSTRWQFIYDWTQFYHQCPQTIVQLAFRPANDSQVIAGGTIMGATVQLATSLTEHNMADPLFANNLDPADVTTCFMGDITVPAYTGPALGMQGPWLIQIPLSTPFYYDPTTLRDLVIDITLPNGSPTGFLADGEFPSTVAGRYGHSTDSTSASWNFGNPDAAPIVEIGYTLGSPVHFNLTGFTTGFGVGDLLLQFTNIPGNAVEGYTLISSIPASELGKGPLFGLFPGLLTFDIITRPVGLGDPLHWQPGAPMGLFPTTPLQLAPGTLAGLAGQTWEIVGVALDGLGQVAGQTQPISLAW